MTQGRLEEFGIYKLASQLFDEFWADSEIVGKDFRGHELVKRQTCSLDSICANTGIPAEDQTIRARRDRDANRRMIQDGFKAVGVLQSALQEWGRRPSRATFNLKPSNGDL